MDDKILIGLLVIKCQLVFKGTLPFLGNTSIYYVVVTPITASL